ncbi:patatin-like phospholipase family protein [Azotobacter beijerinckii]|uniref:Predicted acylesterase/phospholipase RssA, contains patatin domain n=1 Tax=Azotobacter beijerinckii TaxID=170623 RepID=A0A1I4FYP9_9GAMM|nr:patatin-like phospholipase family protein [Azotobacter beijerinckii]SFB54958.1 Predicted acylesterase/phospholipase RssA, contains patatin domain [Azotobacter beijerinckii]SFL23022.1 Predicted acylesterase/phospholipase RssA, contains patatin domain [Azotobacter beijerinckii]
MKFKKLGLALSGGGGKGAYQIGVWQALRDLGLDGQLSAISGTSVGGLNGTMFAQGKLDQAREMWLNIGSRNMLSLQDVPGLAAQLASMAAGGLVAQAISHFISTKGFFKQDGLKSMIAEGLDAGRLASSALPLTVALHNTAANRVDYLPVRDAHSAADMLLGTAALPMIFDEVRIQGSVYTDGGFYWGLPDKNVDNTPIIPLIEAGCDTIIVVYLSPDDLSIDPRHYPGVRILPIVPANSLGGVTATLDFSNEGAARRMEQGYTDGLQVFRHLELFLSNEAQYEALWERARLAAEQERRLGDNLHGVDQKHSQTVGDIQDFDRQIRNDDFSQKLDLADDDTPVALDRLALENTALLADIERRRIETAVDNFLAQHANNRRTVESAMLDALAALSPAGGRAAHLREQGLLSRFMGALTGKNQQIAAENDRDLAQAQFAALRLIGAVQEKGAVTLEFACTLQNRLNGAFAEIQRLGESHNQDLHRVYRSLAGVYCKLRERLSAHEDRLDALERTSRLHDWLLHPNSLHLDGKALTELPTALRLSCLANDFFRLTDGQWTVRELNSLKEMCLKVGLSQGHPVQIGEFCAQLSHLPACLQALTQQLAVLPQAGQPNPTALWLRDLRAGTADTDNDSALAHWGYGAATELPAWDFLAELLYHLKAAGFSVVRSSDLSQYKERWQGQLQVLDDLLGENILPKSFAGEITVLRKEIAGFHLKVPLIGKFSVGKSTLLNSWLGENIQKDDLGACTSLATEFHYAEPGAEKLVIHWLEDVQSGSVRREEKPLAAYTALLDDPRTAAQPPLFIELHLSRNALARHSDLVLVDTPGLGSNNGQHEHALQQYIGEAVSCILCVTRISQVGIDERAFIDRQRSLGQDFSLLICQDALNNPSQRETLRRTLAEQAGLDPSQPVRACSAREGDLNGFEDLLAHLEQQKAGLFHSRFAPRVQALLTQAERLIRRQLAMDTGSEQLLEQKKIIDKGMARLEENFAGEQDSLLRDCRGPITRQVLATVNSYLRSRRQPYAQMLLGGQGIGPLLTADARNACQLAVEQNLTPRFKEACQSLGSHIEQGAFDGPLLVGEGPAGLEAEQGVGGAAAGAAAGAAIGSMLPVIGTMIGGLIGGLLGLFVSRSSKESEAEGKANEAIESVIGQLQSLIPDILEKNASQFLAEMRDKIAAQLAAQRENLERIEQQLTEDRERKQQIQDKAQKALGKVARLLEHDGQPSLPAEETAHVA